ncbi:MAG: hypothetical protein KatS3mg048_3654 [Caldilinea sp.]|nr:MAG: hypothetical protein KatS3mg048_3654 [Caldilinea sp.]
MPIHFTAAQPPVPMRRPTQHTLHGDVRIDDYHWLRNRDDPEVIAYLDAENAYTARVLRDTEPLQEALFQEMRRRIRETDSTAPVQDGDYWYYRRTVAGLDYPIYCRRAHSLEGEEEILLDVNELAAGHAFCEVGEFAVSPDHSLLAYALDRKGDEAFTIFIKDLRTGELLPDRIEGAYYGLEWGNDNATLFYTTLDHAHRPDALWRHRLGDAQANDVLLWREPDERFFVNLYKTRSRRFIVLHLHSNMTSEAHVLDADAPDAPLRLIEPRRRGHEYFVEHRGDRFYVLSNDGAQDFRVLTAPVEAPDMAAWRELIPETPGVWIERIELFQDHLALFEWANGGKRVRVVQLAPTQPEVVDVHVVAFGEESYAVDPEENPTFDTTVLRLRYSSLKTPETIYAYDMAQRTLQMLKQEEIKGYDPDAYETRALVGDRSRRRTGSDLARSPQRDCPGRRSSLPPLRLWRLRRKQRTFFSRQPAEPARTRFPVCDRPCARRQRERPRLVSQRQVAAQEKHLHRFYRRRRNADRPGLHLSRTADDPGAQRRRPPDGRRCEHAARSLRRRHRRSPVRRRPQHHARPHAPFDRHRV